MIELRAVSAEDLDMLREMAIQTQVDTFAVFNTAENMDQYIKEAYDRERMSQEILEEGSRYEIAWDGNEAAGFFRLRRNDEARAHLGENTIELQRLYVKKQYQGKKVGARLMERAIAFAREKKYEWLWLGVWERNFKAQEFYQKWGFSRFSEHIFQMGDDPQTDWLLKLRL